MSYRVFYGDGRERTNDDAPLTGTDSRNVQVILQRDPEIGPVFATGSDYYVWDNDQWRGVDIFGLFDFLMDTGLVLFGRTIANSEYRDILLRAKVEKTMWLKDERRPHD